MVRAVVAGVWMALATVGCAQDAVPHTGAGLLRGAAAIGPGWLVQHPITNLYVNGRLEYFVEDAISFRGDGFWYVDSQQHHPLLAENSQLCFGPMFHRVRNRLDLLAGIQAGLSFTQPASPVAQTQNEPPTPLRAVPNLSVATGLAYAVWEHFHFFLDLRYVQASYPGYADGSLGLGEVTLMGGLGWQWDSRRQRSTAR